MVKKMGEREDREYLNKTIIKPYIQLHSLGCMMRKGIYNSIKCF